MKKSQKIIVLLVLVVGLLLRLHNYDVYPQRGATSDEYTYSFLGVSLLTQGVPISWSHFAYENRQDVTINTIHFPIVQPYFDHPPLAGLLVGGWAFLNGERTFADIKLSTIRLVPVALSALTSLFVFLLAYRLTDYMTALWALLIYSTVTIFVIQSRVVLAENFLTPIILGALYFFQKTKKMNRRSAVILGFFSVASFWTKEAGITLPIALFLLFLYKKARKSALIAFLATTILGIGAYALYGWAYDWKTFMTIIAVQGGREVGPQTLWNILSTPVIINKVYYDGWYYFGFFALALLLADIKRFFLLLFPSIIYFLFLLFSLTKEGQSGWYLIPLFPFLAIAAAIVLRQMKGKFTGSYFVFLLFVGFTLMQTLFQKSFGLVSIQYRELFIIIVVPYIVLFFLDKKYWLNFLNRLYFYVAICLAVLTTYSYIHPA